MLNLAMLLEDSAYRYPDRVAVVGIDGQLTFRELDEFANKIANLLRRRGVEPGAKVALSCPNVIEFPAIAYGVSKAGCVLVPLNILLTSHEIAYQLGRADVQAYFCHSDILATGLAALEVSPACRHLFVVGESPEEPPQSPVERLVDVIDGLARSFDTHPTSAEDTAAILFTSGTSGHPRGAELSHANLLLNVVADNRAYGPPVGEPDVQLIALPLFHSFGATAQLHAGVSNGSTSVLMKRFDPRTALDLMASAEVTLFAGVPTMYLGLLETAGQEPQDLKTLGNLRVALSGGAALPASIQATFRDEFGLDVIEGYGLTETSPGCLLTDPALGVKTGSVGVPMWGVRVELLDPSGAEITSNGPEDVGEIVVQGHNVMKGYYGDPVGTAEVLRNGWFHTGDLAWRDESGSFYVVDRLKDLIIRGGYNVYPREVEEALVQHPAVAQAAVVGVPDPRLGEEVLAFVILRQGASIKEGDLVSWSRQMLAAHKYPRSVRIVTSFPTTATGKTRKVALLASLQPD